jgi:Na+-transporting methylmalonyl-CoA/oxaloacetate decarboxylase gamma subunit
MALKIRCQECSKKISIDEAFAGGVCRCPYCKALTMVPGGETAASAGDRALRPDRPDRPDRPMTPGGAPAARPPAPGAPARAAAPAHGVPLARPVMIQGVVTIVFMGMFIVMLVLAVFLYVYLSKQQQQQPPAHPYGAPPVGVATTGASAVPVSAADKGMLDMALTAPVVFVVDDGGGMIDAYDPAKEAVCHAIMNMGDQGFNIVMLRSDTVKTLTDSGWTTGGKGGLAKATAFFPLGVAGVGNLQAGLEKAIALGPKTVVLLTSKAPEDVAAIIDKAKSGSVAICTVGIGADDAAEALKNLADKTGGQSRAYTPEQLAQIISTATPLPQPE